MKKEVKKEESVEISLNDEEKAIIKNQRDLAARKSKCIEELSNVLQKYNAKIIVDPNSKLGNPSAAVVMN